MEKDTKLEEWKKRYPIVETEQIRKISWIYKKLSVSKVKLAFMLQSEEFVDGIYQLIEDNITVNDESVFPLAEKVYNEMDYYREEYPNFNFRAAKGCVNQLRRAIEAKNHSDSEKSTQEGI